MKKLFIWLEHNSVGMLVAAVVASMVDVAAVGMLVVTVVASMVDVAAVGSW